MNSKRYKKNEDTPVNYKYIAIRPLIGSRERNIKSLFYNDSDLRVSRFYKIIIFIQ